MFGAVRRVVVSVVAVAVAASVSASSRVAMGAASPTGPTALTTGERSVCVKVSRKSQTVNVPATGGVRAELTIAGFPSGVAGCLPIRVGTGDAIDPTVLAATQTAGAPAVAPALAALGAAGWAPRAEGGAPVRPLLTVTVGSGTDASPLVPFGAPVVVTGTTLTAATSLGLPDGTYYAVITRPDGTRSEFNPIVRFVARKGVLRVATETGEDGKKLPVMSIVSGASTLSLYPLGVVPSVEGGVPTVDPTDPSATSTPGSSVPAITMPATTLVPVPPHQPVPKGVFGAPPPDYGALMGTVSWSWSNCTRSGLCVMSGRPVSSGGGSPSELQIPAGFEGSVAFSLSIGYMGIRQVAITGCPSWWKVSASISGIGAIVAGARPAGAPPRTRPCTITFSTLPPGRNGSGYGLELVVRELDMGVRPT